MIEILKTIMKSIERIIGFCGISYLIRMKLKTYLECSPLPNSQKSTKGKE
jgi:hypothetical protein